MFNLVPIKFPKNGPPVTKKELKMAISGHKSLKMVPAASNGLNIGQNGLNIVFHIKETWLKEAPWQWRPLPFPGCSCLAQAGSWVKQSNNLIWCISVLSSSSSFHTLWFFIFTTISNLKTHCVVAADSPERDLAIRSKQSSGNARCSSNGTLIIRDN